MVMLLVLVIVSKQSLRTVFDDVFCIARANFDELAGVMNSFYKLLDLDYFRILYTFTLDDPYTAHQSALQFILPS